MGSLFDKTESDIDIEILNAFQAIPKISNTNLLQALEDNGKKTKYAFFQEKTTTSETYFDFPPGADALVSLTLNCRHAKKEAFICTCNTKGDTTSIPLSQNMLPINFCCLERHRVFISIPGNDEPIHINAVYCTIATDVPDRQLYRSRKVFNSTEAERYLKSRIPSQSFFSFL